MMAAYFKTMKPLLGDEPLFVSDGLDKNRNLGKKCYYVAQVVGFTIKNITFSTAYF